jgi:hypothetical protein
MEGSDPASSTAAWVIAIGLIGAKIFFRRGKVIFLTHLSCLSCVCR